MMKLNTQSIVTTSRKAYSIFQKIFCCRCMQCLRKQVVLTSDMRKQTLQRMIRNYVINEEEENLYDPIKLMILIYLCQDEAVPQRFIGRCRLNASGSDTYRTDLMFYIPQLCNYLVFHIDLRSGYLSDSVEQGCRLSFYYAHLYYFYMHSLQQMITSDQVQVFRKVELHNQLFLEEMSKFYQGQMLISIEFLLKEQVKTVPTDPDIAYMIKMYGVTDQERVFARAISFTDITLPNYASIFAPHDEPELYSFRSTLNFFGDLFAISESLKNSEDKKTSLKSFLQRVNSRLPSSVYIPFCKDFTNFYNVLNIAYQQTRIFSTKERAPFYICLQVYNPVQQLEEEQRTRFWQQAEIPITLKVLVGLTQKHFPHEGSIFARHDEPIRTSRPRKNTEEKEMQVHTEIFAEKESHFLSNRLLEFTNEMQTQPRLPDLRAVEMKPMSRKQIEKKLFGIFGETNSEMTERIRQQSIYGNLKTWRLLHIIVKTNDNLKQQEFALQLISQFDYIFKLEGLPLLLTPFEVLSMGPDCGIIEMVRESITIDRLKRHLHEKFDKPLPLKQFFELYYQEGLVQAKETFMRSLAAYSLVMYFLQAKDRHNGNILLHRSGKIFHIDFGFFLSNMPGKGVELQKNCPFKLLSDQLAVLDGPESYYFKRYRELLFLYNIRLFRGFKAVRKHQNKILILVKMMYSSSGSTMPCFEKGEKAIRSIEERLNPPNVTTDAQLNLHCQSLIDASLDNWATTLYDRIQYYTQGIFY